MAIAILTRIALLVVAAGFVWFAGRVIWLGLKQIFSLGSETKTNKRQKGN